MNKEDFIYDDSREKFVAHLNGIEVTIRKDIMTDEVLALTNKILKNYSQNVNVVADYLSMDDGIKNFNSAITKDEIAQKLNEPILDMDENGGILTYCNHALDLDHIIDLAFGGCFEEFHYVSLDG